MKRKEWATEYLHFSRRDRLAIGVLLTLTVLIYLLPRWIPPSPRPQPADTSWIAAIKALEEKKEKEVESQSKKNRLPKRPAGVFDQHTNGATRKGALFYFDPNTLPAAGWRQLGLREKTIQTIERYRTKGGRFRQARDLQKVYGLFPDEYARLEPWVQIAATPEPLTEKADPAKERPVYARKPAIDLIDINTADTSAYISLPWIGSKLAQRIVLFREKLGGFYSIRQLAETYGLPDSTFQKIRPFLKMDPPVLRKINLNTATLEELKAHPYIRYTLARPILAYRTEHGRFEKPEDLKKVAAITDEVYQKLSPYLHFE